MGSITVGDGLPVFGRRLLPVLTDEIAYQDPDRECMQIPRSSNPKDGWRVITWKDMARAINRCAFKMLDDVGNPKPDTFPTIAYIGPNDVRYLIMVVASIKAGYKCLFISPRNSQEGQLNLFEKTDCDVLVFAEEMKATVQPWLKKRATMRGIQVSPVDAWFPDHDVPHFPYRKTFEEADWDPLFVLHTSGSTGLPKPVIVRQGMLHMCDAFHNVGPFQGADSFPGEWAKKSKRHFSPLPLFHIAGIICIMMNVWYWERPVCLGITGRPPSPDLILECLENIDVESAMVAPAILEDLSQSPEGMAALKKLNLVIFGGGNLAREAGNRLVQNSVKILNAIGATEYAPLPMCAQPNLDQWQYFIFDDDTFGCDWRKQAGEEDVYELVFVRKNSKHPGLQGWRYTFPDATEWHTKDLYRAHPTLPHHWLYYGRLDNIIVFSNGEKLNPTTIEELVTDHPGVKGALVVGSERFQAGLLVEPKVHPETEKEEQDFLDSVWPLVERANAETVAHGRIARTLMAVSNPTKPFLRAGKGTIQRAMTVKLYKDEIDQLYEKAGNNAESEAPKLDVASEDSLAESIVETFRACLGATGLEADVDFYAAGVDSMGIINAARLLRAGLKEAGYKTDAESLGPRIIYRNPTPRRLARHILASIVQGGVDGVSDEGQQVQATKSLHEKYTQNLLRAKPNRPDASQSKQTVVIAGSNGNLGSYLMDFMARDPHVAKIVCLNRHEDGGKADQVEGMKNRGLDAAFVSSGPVEVEFYHADMSKAAFGLSADVYDRLLDEADRFIHNAWPVNWNLPVESFEPHIQAVRNIADLAARARKRVAVCFVSTIASAENWTAGHGEQVPEARLADYALAVGGYGRSKLAGSLVLEDASRPGAGDFPAAIVRVGQIAGPEAEAGVWNRQEWLPSIVASSLHLGALPADLGSTSRVDWTPVERVARLVLEAVGVSREAGDNDVAGYYHAVNPHATAWEALAPAVREFYGGERIRELVSFREWIDRLAKSQSDDPALVRSNPGLKLIDAYRGFLAAYEAGNEAVIYDMTETLRRCSSARETTAITPEMMKNWCRQWAF